MTESARSDHLRIAAIQMVSGVSVSENLAAAGRLIDEAAADGAQLIALPEYFCLMGRNDTDKVDVREQPGRGPIQAFLAAAAARHRVWLVGGTLPVALQGVSDRIGNTTFVYAPDGSVAARYDKIHLFGFTKGDEHYDESRTIAAGAEPVSFEATLGDQPIRVGLSICYDLRFPELYRGFAAAGIPDLLIVPAAFTYTTGSAHWEILLRARAIENQCYVLAPAQGGRHENGRRTWGHSMLIDPWGEIVAGRDEGEGVVIGHIDPMRLAEVRETLPALKHRVL
ncbi:MAG: carbon-nitrogen hydrolase family protein [Burkholderiaceae bacterium]